MRAAIVLAVLVTHPDVMSIFREILQRGLFGYADTETAAFIVRKSDDDFRCVVWPATNDYHGARFVDAMPKNVVAIVHTHPNASPRPSPGDRYTAIRLGIPIYSLTIGSIYEVDGQGQIIEHVRNHHWFDRDAPSRDLCSELVRRTR